MWPSTSSVVDNITAPRLAAAIVSAVAAASIGYYAYQNHGPHRVRELPPGGGLHRSNAIRRRSHRQHGTGSSASSEAGGDENAENFDFDGLEARDGETVMDPGDDFWAEPDGHLPNQRAGHNIVNLLFRVSEDNARRNGCVHRGCQCNSCGMVPIRGVRYRCANCADFDLCETCESQGYHTKTHIFYKIRVPAPPFGPRQMQAVWYTGDPDNCRRNLPRGLIQKLSRDTGFERPELEAFWEQWTFMANTEWRDDPDDLNIAMDRKTFERCLVPTGGSRHAAPNLIHDRMFSFYDSNRDDLIGFSEFLHGLSYRKRKGKLLKVFEGYDIDEDGYVNRRDFLRMFRAYYVLYKQMHKDILDGLEDQLLASMEAQQLVRGRQPLSSLFGREGRVPPGDASIRHEGKQFDRDGGVRIVDGQESVVVEDRGDTATREEILASLFACATEDRPRRRFFTRNDADTNWRTVRRLSTGDLDRTYLVTLLDPPTTLEDLPGLFEVEEPGDTDESSSEDNDGEVEVNGEENDEDDYSANNATTDSELISRAVSYLRRRAPRLEKHKRDMARRQLHERWRRRQFYLDEEEGGAAPEDWDGDEDVLENLRKLGESSKTAAEDDKIHFSEDQNQDSPYLDPSIMPNGIHARWKDKDRQLPGPERDAGKEILYQVTQQAFNELLDTIFKPAEDLAVLAAETKPMREKYSYLLEMVKVDVERPEAQKPDADPNTTSTAYKPPKDMTLKELLDATGFSIVPDAEGRNAVEITDDGEASHASAADEATGEEPGPDPTLPQNRPDKPIGMDDESYVWYPVTKAAALDSDDDYETVDEDEEGQGEAEAEAEEEEEDEEGNIKLSDLQLWKRLELAEIKAKERGGWGKLNFQEFEAIYKKQENEGNRLDYLGSWIDFCIP